MCQEHGGKCIWYIGCQGPSILEDSSAESGPHSEGEDGSSRFGINLVAPNFITPAQQIDKFRGQTTTPGKVLSAHCDCMAGLRKAPHTLQPYSSR